MSILNTSAIFCDGPLCKDLGKPANPPGTDNARQLRLKSKACGWSRRHGQDFCVTCQTEMKKRMKKYPGMGPV